jgi:hypothetical protein
LRQGIGAVIACAQGAVGSYEIGIAKLAHGAGAVSLAPRPQITTRKATKDRRLSCIRAFALQGVKNLFDLVAHGTHAKKADSRSKKGEHSRTAQQQAKAIAARFLYMVVLYMAQKRNAPSAGTL